MVVVMNSVRSSLRVRVAGAVVVILAPKSGAGLHGKYDIGSGISATHVEVVRYLN